MSERKDHVITEDDFPTTAIARWDANIAAIRLSRKLEDENRPATPQEQKVLGKYSGFGDSAFNQAFQYARDPAWQRRREDLEELVSPEEYEGIKLSRLNAFYTTPGVVRSMWSTLSKMGADRLKDPKVLEPSAGSGRFLGLQPPKMAAKSERTAVELDPMTANVLKRLYPETRVYASGFEDAPLPDDHYDIAISNVPFGDVKVFDRDFNATGRKYLTNQVHNYFFAKTLDKLRPGGVMAYITTAGTMNAPTSEPIRQYIADKADLVGAVRLPDDAFPDTQVVTDIMYLRKRAEGEKPGDDSWVKSETVKIPTGYYQGHTIDVPVNKYFLDNPDKVLGSHSGTGSMYRGHSYTVKSDANTPTLTALEKAQTEIAEKFPRVKFTRKPTGDAPKGAAVRPQPVRNLTAKYVLEDGKLRVSRGGKVSDHDLPKKTAAKVTSLLNLRDTARKLIDQESSETDDKVVEGTRERLGDLYDEHIETYDEAINTPANRKLLGNEADDHLLFALEHYDRDSECWQPSDIMHQRIVGATPAQKVNTPADAMQVVMNESGKLDFDRMGELLGQSAESVREELSDDQLVFKSPAGDSWIPAQEYLTGNVRGKLKAAELAAKADPAYEGHVKALGEVLPTRVSAEDIATPLGAPWIPAEVVNEWVQDEFRIPFYGRGGSKTGNYFRYLGETESFIGVNERGNKATQGGAAGGSWTLAEQFNSNYADITYGTYDRSSRTGMRAKDILLKTLQGAPIALTKPGEESGTRVHDAEGTLAAQQKADAMQKAFEEWIWKDPERRARLEERYNDTHNAMRPRIFDGSHQTFPGMSATWQKQLRPHQRAAVARVVNDGTALLAHEVGFGKSATMVAAAMERKRLGLANKPVFVVPKATHKQFTSDFMKVYPGARILAPDSTDFQKGKREAFLNRIATGDWDGVILSYEQFERIPLSPETESKWIRQQMVELQGALMEMSGEVDNKQAERTQKQMSKKLQNYKVRLQYLRDKMAQRSDDTRTFEDLGIDQLYVDEADNYKNLPYVTRMTAGRAGIKGLPQSEANRSWDMYMKIRYLQDKNGQKPDGSFAKGGVVFATGTPVANTIAETWTMMRYLQPAELKRRGLDNFDAWAKTYGHVKSGMEYTAGGKYKTVQRFSRFVNLPELSNLFQNVADIRVASEVPEMMEAQPRLIDDTGQPKRITVVAPSHEALEDYMADIIKRVDALKNTPPNIDNMLKISSDARKASMDVQMVEPNAPYNPQGKIGKAAENIARIYEEEADRKGTQLVFLDLGTPKETKDKDAGEADEEELTGEEADLLTNVYGRLRTELSNKGVPASQVAFIHEHDRPGDREEILEKVRRGDVRVLVGSTQKLGVGVNVQDRAAAAHHIDVPWRPRDVEQREGRVIRQGNVVYGPELDDEKNVIGPGRGVRIYQYVQENSFDRFMWQAVEEKARGIKSLMKREQPHRGMEDIDEFVIGASEAKALASGNPLAIRAEELRQKVEMGRLAHAAHKRSRFEAEQRTAMLESQAEAYRKQLPALEADAKRVKALDPDADFTMTVGDETFEKRADAAKALEAEIRDTPYDHEHANDVRAGKPGAFQPLGTFKGFEFGAINDYDGRHIVVRHPETQHPYVSKPITPVDEDLSATGLMTRLDNGIKGIPARAAKVAESIETTEENLRLYAEQMATQFDGGPALDYAERQLRVIRARLADPDDKTKILREDDDAAMDVLTDWTPSMAIASPAKAPAETPREIPDADPIDLQEAAEIVSSPSAADTPHEVAETLEDQLDSPPREARTIADSAARNLADVPSPQAEPEEGVVRVPLDELDAIAAEFNFSSFAAVAPNVRMMVLEMYRARAGLPREAKVEPESEPVQAVNQEAALRIVGARDDVLATAAKREKMFLDSELSERQTEAVKEHFEEERKAIEAHFKSAVMPEPWDSNNSDNQLRLKVADIKQEEQDTEAESPPAPEAPAPAEWNKEKRGEQRLGTTPIVVMQEGKRHQVRVGGKGGPVIAGTYETEDKAKEVAVALFNADWPTGTRIADLPYESRQNTVGQTVSDWGDADFQERARDQREHEARIRERNQAKAPAPEAQAEAERDEEALSSVVQVVLEKLRADQPLQNAIANSDGQNVGIEYEKARDRAYADLLSEGRVDLYKEWVDDPENAERLDVRLRMFGHDWKRRDEPVAPPVSEPAVPEAMPEAEPEPEPAKKPRHPRIVDVNRSADLMIGKLREDSDFQAALAGESGVALREALKRGLDRAAAELRDEGHDELFMWHSDPTYHRFHTRLGSEISMRQHELRPQEPEPSKPTSSEMLASATEGPVALTGPGSVMERMAEEREEQREPEPPAREANPKSDGPILNEAERKIRASFGRGKQDGEITSNQYVALDDYARSKGVDLLRENPIEGLGHPQFITKADAVRVFDALALIGPEQVREGKLREARGITEDIQKDIKRVEGWTPDTFKGGGISGPDGPAWATEEGVEQEKREALAALNKKLEAQQERERALHRVAGRIQRDTSEPQESAPSEPSTVTPEDDAALSKRTGPTAAWMKKMAVAAGAYSKNKGHGATYEERGAALKAENEAREIVERQSKRLSPADVGLTEENAADVARELKNEQEPALFKALSQETDPARQKDLLKQIHHMNLRLEMAARLLRDRPAPPPEPPSRPVVKDPARSREIAELWGNPSESAYELEKDYNANFAKLRDIPEDSFPPGEKERIVKVWESFGEKFKETPEPEAQPDKPPAPSVPPEAAVDSGESESAERQRILDEINVLWTAMGRDPFDSARAAQFSIEEMRETLDAAKQIKSDLDTAKAKEERQARFTASLDWFRNRVREREQAEADAKREAALAAPEPEPPAPESEHAARWRDFDKELEALKERNRERSRELLENDPQDEPDVQIISSLPRKTHIPDDVRILTPHEEDNPNAQALKVIRAGRMADIHRENRRKGASRAKSALAAREWLARDLEEKSATQRQRGAGDSASTERADDEDGPSDKDTEQPEKPSARRRRKAKTAPARPKRSRSRPKREPTDQATLTEPTPGDPTESEPDPDKVGSPDKLPASKVVVDGARMYQGHKGPGIGYLKEDLPDRRDGDSDTVVGERRPRKRDEYEKSPVQLPLSGKYARLASSIRGQKAKARRSRSRGRANSNTGLKSSRGGVPSIKIVGG